MINISNEELNILKWNDFVPLTCDYCSNNILQKKRYVMRKKTDKNFCNNKCQQNYSKKNTIETLIVTGKKKCVSCKEQKEIKCFNKSKAQTDGYNKICRICSNLNSKKYYNKNTEQHKINVKNRKEIIVEENKKFIIDFLENNPCIDCEEKNILVLDFDHRNRAEKEYDISDMMDLKLDKIKKEIEKCDVRCANCHRIITAKQDNNYKFRYLNKL